MSFPTASEMAERTQKIIDERVKVILERISNKIEKTPEFNMTINIKEDDEKYIEETIKKLNELGYRTTYTGGYYEDRPCGGYVFGKLYVDWNV